MLTISDVAHDQAGRPLFRYPVRAYFASVDLFLQEEVDGTFRVGEALDVRGYTVITDRTGTFTLEVLASDEIETGGGDTEFHVILPDGGHYHGVVPPGVEGPLTLYELWDQYAWTGPAGPGHTNPAPIDQMFGMLLL